MDGSIEAEVLILDRILLIGFRYNTDFQWV